MPRQISPRLLWGALLFVSSPLFAQVANAQGANTQGAKPFTPAPLFPREAISQKTLPNGVLGVVKNAPDFDLVNIQVWVKAGSRHERDDESGLAQLAQNLVTRGSKNFPAGEDNDEGGFLGQVRAVGGDAGALTSRDATFYSATVAAPFFSRTLTALADSVLRPDLSDGAIEDAKLSLADAIVRRSFDAVATASDLAYATAYTKHPYRRPAIGNEKTIGNLRAPKIRAFFNRQYVGKNISVIVVGRVPADAGAQIARAFAGASSAAPVPVPSVQDPFPGAKEVTRRQLVPRDALVLAWRSPGIDKVRDVVALDTLLSFWREGLDANLRRVLLRDGDEGPNKPLVAAYDVDFLTQRDPGLFLISLSGVSDREGAIAAVKTEIERVQTQELSDAEFLRAKNQLRAQYIEQGENAAGQAGALGFYAAINTPDFAVNYLSECAKVTKADLLRVAKTYLAPEKTVQVEVVPLQRPKMPGGDEGLNRDPVITASWRP